MMASRESTTSSNSHAIEVLAAQVQHEREMRERLEQQIAREFANANRAIELAAESAQRALDAREAVIEKRLSDLNGEAGRLAVIVGSTVPREVWTEADKRREEWQRGIERELAALREARSGEVGKDTATQQILDSARVVQRWLIGLVVAVLLTILTILVGP